MRGSPSRAVGSSGRTDVSWSRREENSPPVALPTERDRKWGNSCLAGLARAKGLRTSPEGLKKGVNGLPSEIALILRG